MRRLSASWDGRRHLYFKDASGGRQSGDCCLGRQERGKVLLMFLEETGIQFFGFSDEARSLARVPHAAGDPGL